MVAWKEGLTGWGKQEGLSRADGNGLCLDSSVSYKGVCICQNATTRTNQICSPACTLYLKKNFLCWNVLCIFVKGSIKKLFLCSLTPKSWLSAHSPCRVETSGILWRVMCGSTSRFTTGSDSLHKCHQNQKGILLLNQQPTPPSLPFLSAF